MIDTNLIPGERRHFVHGRIKRAVTGFVTSGFNPLSAAGAFLAPPPSPIRRPPPRSTVARPSLRGAEGKELGRAIKIGPFPGSPLKRRISSFAPLKRCLPGFKVDPVTGNCVPFFLGDRPGRDDQPLQIGPGTPVGDAVMGRYGAALEPGSRIIDRAVCLRGMVLGDDGNCYNRSQIKNSERMWPRGRRPLLTGGDMRALSTAPRAAPRLTATAVRLQDIGLIKKPVAKRPPKKKH